MNTPLYGLTLAGGGARAAYQAGVLRAIAEILAKERKHEPTPFQIFTGESAGAINCCVLVSEVENFLAATSSLWEYWATIRLENIFRTSPFSLITIASRWLKDLSLGGILKSNGTSVYLLDTAPLTDYLLPKIDFRKIKGLVASKQIHGIAVSATNYATGSAITFFDGDPSIQAWTRSQRMGRRATLSLPHVLASTAIPILFPPVRIGQSFYGDGSVRLKTPLSPCIHLGAEKILAIGSLYRYPIVHTAEINEDHAMETISLADIAGVLLSAGFLDSLDADIERMSRVNQTLQLIPREKHQKLPTQLRKVDFLMIRPSRDLTQLASDAFQHFNVMLRYLLRGLGTSSESGWDLMSYLAFDRAYTKQLLELGHHDALEQKKSILDFFS
jgi:NTE family protein